MDNRNYLEKLIVDNKPVQCTKCNGKMKYLQGGMYQCMECGYESLDDFGKVKQFLNENGPTSALIISKATGVNAEIVEMFLKQGRLEIPENSKYYIKCEK